MTSKFRLRYIFRPLVNLIAKALIKLRVTPNIATIIMLLFAIFSLISLVFLQNLLFFAILIFFTGIMDGCDGAIARITDKSTAFGGFFDSVMDRISEFVIFLALLIYTWDQLLWDMIDMKIIIFFTFLGTLMISYIRARAENFFKEKPQNANFDIGLMARSERLFYLFITSIIVYLLNAFFNELLFLFMWLVIGTALFRFLRIKKQIKNLEL
ncbi:MAG: CDP-alcohol phosphatidyltransferase family protein [Promethearchaeota archaeon]|nr:MAG: CDP-alcohol phosphatidyltransferase family protein [Candidatus Lokiarchaeota archaeon]